MEQTFERFWKRVERRPDGCWQWNGGRSVNGYGACTDYLAPPTRTTYAHRLAWRILRGEIPDGLQIDHLCRNKLCVNPEHLEPVTQAENLRRRTVKTACNHGHELTPENVYRTRTGTRSCRACRRDAARRFRVIHGSNPYRQSA